MLSCKNAGRMICDYLEDTLSLPERMSIRRHLDRCHNCNLILETARRTLEVYFDRDIEPTKAQVA